MKKVVLLFIFANSYLSIANSAQISEKVLLERCFQNKAHLNTCVVKSELIVETLDTVSDGPSFEKQKHEFRTDGVRADLIIDKEFNITDINDATSPHDEYKIRFFFDGNRWMQENKPGDSSKIWAHISTDKEKYDISMPQSRGGATLDGIFEGDKEPIDIILKHASRTTVRSQMEEINGVECHVIDAVTPHGKYSLWIDPKHGYNIAKARVLKAGDDILNGKPLDNYTETERIRELRKRGMKIPGQKLEFSFMLDGVKFKKIKDTWIPIEANYQSTVKYEDGREITHKKNYKRTSINLNPNFEEISAFVPDIPNGTEVFLDDIRGIKYRWQDGKLVTDIDDMFLEQLNVVANEISSDDKINSIAPVEKSKENIDTSNSTSITKSELRGAPRESVQPKTFKLSAFLKISGVICLVIIGFMTIRHISGGRS